MQDGRLILDALIVGALGQRHQLRLCQREVCGDGRRIVGVIRLVFVFGLEGFALVGVIVLHFRAFDVLGRAVHGL